MQVRLLTHYVHLFYNKNEFSNDLLIRPSIKLKTLKGKQTLSWKKISGATGYVIYQKKGNGSFKKVKTISYKNTSYTFKTAKNVTYSYRLVPYRTVNKKVKTGPASAVKTGKAK